MFCLQVDAPGNGVFEFLAGFDQQINGFCVCHTSKVVVQDVMQSVQQTFVYEAVEEFHFFGRVVQYILNDIFQHFFCHFHVVFQISESHFGFDHPEFRSMTRGVGVFCTECGTECVNIAECHGKCFSGKLTTYSQVCFFAEEVFGEVYSAVFFLRQVVQVQCGNAEHFPSAFAVAAGDDGSMCVYKAFALEELMDCISNQASHTECCGEHVCSGTQISDLAQEFYAVTFFLQRVVRSGSAFDGNFLCLYFKGLFCFGCFHQQTFDDDGSANTQFCDFGIVGQRICFKNDLDVFEERTVVQFDEAEIFGYTHGTDPAAQCHFFIGIVRCAAVN